MYALQQSLPPLSHPLTHSFLQIFLLLLATPSTDLNEDPFESVVCIRSYHLRFVPLVALISLRLVAASFPHSNKALILSFLFLSLLVTRLFVSPLASHTQPRSPHPLDSIADRIPTLQVLSLFCPILSSESASSLVHPCCYREQHNLNHGQGH